MPFMPVRRQDLTFTCPSISLLLRQLVLTHSGASVSGNPSQFMLRSGQSHYKSPIYKTKCDHFALLAAVITWELRNQACALTMEKPAL